MITVGELFAGIGGIGFGLEMTGGFEVKWQVERDEYASKVLAKHWPDVVRWDDVVTFPPPDTEWSVDVITAGFPCTDISVANKEGKGLKGERSGLFYEVVRIAERLKPKYILLENVAALLTRGLGEVLRELAEIGFNAEWHCIPAAAVGAPHKRDRIFIIGYSNGHCELPQRITAEQVSRQSTLSRQLSRIRQHAGRQQWATESRVARTSYGVRKRVDRTRCLGNAVVPQVAMVLGERILEWEKCNETKVPGARDSSRKSSRNYSG